MRFFIIQFKIKSIVEGCVRENGALSVLELLGAQNICITSPNLFLLVVTTVDLVKVGIKSKSLLIFTKQKDFEVRFCPSN